MQNEMIANAASRIRTIANTLETHMNHRLGSPVTLVKDAVAKLRQLEQELPSRDPEDFASENLKAFGYNTVMGYLSDEDHLSLLMMKDPVRNTIKLGHKATALCHARGLKVVKVPACAHIKQRYAKVTHVNAYPLSVLAEAIYDFQS